MNLFSLADSSGNEVCRVCNCIVPLRCPEPSLCLGACRRCFGARAAGARSHGSSAWALAAWVSSCPGGLEQLASGRGEQGKVQTEIQGCDAGIFETPPVIQAWHWAASACPSDGAERLGASSVLSAGARILASKTMGVQGRWWRGDAQLALPSSGSHTAFTPTPWSEGQQPAASPWGALGLARCRVVGGKLRGRHG